MDMGVYCIPPVVLCDGVDVKAIKHTPCLQSDCYSRQKKQWPLEIVVVLLLRVL